MLAEFMIRKGASKVLVLLGPNYQYLRINNKRTCTAQRCVGKDSVAVRYHGFLKEGTQ
jgi:FKBP-type peptidyl-prolyl cis-trans isomerase